MNTLYFLIIFHFVADFMLQGDKVASKKRGVNLEMIKHGAICALFFALPILNLNTNLVVLGASAIFITHILIDAIRVEINKKFKLNPMGYKFWALLGIDQIMHVSVIYFVLRYIYFLYTPMINFVIE